MTGYKALSEQLNELGVDQHASELHGVVTGFVAAGGSLARVDTLMDWLGLDGGQPQQGLFERLFQDIGGQLADPELGFQPLLPGDGEPLSARSRAVSRWCGGFISGFGAGRSGDGPEIDNEVTEVLSDLHKISSMTDEVPDSDENETDLTEIIEYIRVTVLLVFASCALTDNQEG